MDNVREDLKERGVQLSTAYGQTKNREFWRSKVHVREERRKRRKYM